MYRFIWITVCLLNSLVINAGAKSTTTEGVDGYETRAQIDLKQHNKALGLTFASIGFAGDPNCTYQAGPGVIQTAIDAGFDEIRLVEGTHNANIEIADQSINIKGKYATCVAAAFDVVSEIPTHRSILSGVSGAALPTVKISGNTQRNTVLFKNLEITGGEEAQFLTGGGIDVRLADVDLTLDTVQVRNNQGLLGGGLSMAFGSIDVSLIDSLILSNMAEEGGGIYCFGLESTINMRDTGPEKPSGIALNEATNGNGGGLYIESGCDFRSTSGSYGSNGPGDLDLNGILLNSATGDGGGIFARSAAQITLDGARRCGTVFCSGNNDSNVRVSANTADSDESVNGSGGGIYATGENTEINLTNAVIADNTARNGGGLIATDRANIYMSSFYTSELVFPSPPNKCWSPGSCSQIINNNARASAGGIFIQNGSYAFVDRTVIQGNRAIGATAIFLESESNSNDVSVMDLQGSLVTGNGAGGTGDFNDITAIVITRSDAFIRYTTIADNDVTSHVIGAGGASSVLDIRSSIVHQANGIPVYLAFPTSILSPDSGCLMLSSLDDFAAILSRSMYVLDPLFINRGASDFHLRDTSPAIDICFGLSVVTPQDLDRDVRGWDDPAIGNLNGQTFDIGYDENVRFISDLIFRDGFE